MTDQAQAQQGEYLATSLGHSVAEDTRSGDDRDLVCTVIALVRYVQCCSDLSSTSAPFACLICVPPPAILCAWTSGLKQKKMFFNILWMIIYLGAITIYINNNNNFCNSSIILRVVNLGVNLSAYEAMATKSSADKINGLWLLFFISRPTGGIVDLLTLKKFAFLQSRCTYSWFVCWHSQADDGSFGFSRMH